MAFVELHARTAFNFLRGASPPEGMAARAAELGLPAMAAHDRDGVYGVPRFFSSCRERQVRALCGCELTLEGGGILPVLVATRGGYENLCRLITRSKLRGTKQCSPVFRDEIAEFSDGWIALLGEGWSGEADARWALGIFGRDRLFVEVTRQRLRGEERGVRTAVALSEALGLRLVATNRPAYAHPGGRRVLDLFTCIREHVTLDGAGLRLERNGGRHLKGEREMRALFPDLPEAVDNTARVADRLEFSLEDLGYEFPRYEVPPGETMDGFLRKVTMAGARARYGHLDRRVRAQLERELTLIGKLGFAGYFLVVWDIVNFCSEQEIMVQGRGSAANSAVCYSLGITAVDPVGGNLLFERFLSEGRKGWPDIDLDLPSGDRRERVIQEVYRRYGENGAAMTANVITFRGRSTAREIGKAMGFSEDLIGRFSALFGHGDFPHTLALLEQMERAGIASAHPRAKAFAEVYSAMRGLPRHLGQHSGGMIICQGKLDRVMPLERASMEGRVVAQWDKEDCEDLGIVKVDLLGLGMMAVLQDAIELCAARGRPVDLAKIPKDDPETYRMLQRADTIGVFQVESRAQMATLPRMKPATFYDVVIEVAIIRPGPIQGCLTHPYLARRAGKEPVEFIDEKLAPVLERTLGVPLFQEQVLKMAMVMADFSGAEAEELRRAMSFHRSAERMRKVEVKLRAALERNRVAPEAVERIVASIGSFALYGFPESHAISFALLAYASAWLKAHRPVEFYVGLLNNQPMGFYSPDTLLKDARRHGISVLPVDLAVSEWDCTAESDEAVRLGFRCVRGLGADAAARMLAGRPYAGVADFKGRSGLNREELRAVAEVGALNRFSGHRRAALWDVEAEVMELPLVAEDPGAGNEGGARSSPLPPMTRIERVAADYRGMGLTAGCHPMAWVRTRLKGVTKAADLAGLRSGRSVKIAGAVICRQRPGTAKGVLFLSLEDETGVANAIVSPGMFERLRLVITQEPFLIVGGELQNLEGVIHVKARRIEALVVTSDLAPASHDFR